MVSIHIYIYIKYIYIYIYIYIHVYIYKYIYNDGEMMGVIRGATVQICTIAWRLAWSIFDMCMLKSINCICDISYKGLIGANVANDEMIYADLSWKDILAFKNLIENSGNMLTSAIVLYIFKHVVLLSLLLTFILYSFIRKCCINSYRINRVICEILDRQKFTWKKV